MNRETMMKTGNDGNRTEKMKTNTTEVMDNNKGEEEQRPGK